MNTERVTFLIVDDDEVSTMAIRRAIESHGLTNPVVEARDGLEALECLRGGLQQPFVILLDINMPRMTGLEFLAAIRSDPDLLDAVIFVMTTSDAPTDICRSYMHQIAGYIVKEDAYRSIGKAISMLGSYLDVVTLTSPTFKCETLMKTLSSNDTWCQNCVRYKRLQDEQTNADD